MSHDDRHVVTLQAADAVARASRACCERQVPWAGGVHADGEVWDCPTCRKRWAHVIEESDGAWWELIA